MSTTIQATTETPRQARQVILRGRVQGLGVRPTIHRIANQYKLCGQVRNSARGVEIVIEGESAQLSGFVDAIECELAAIGARVVSCEIQSTVRHGYTDFSIAAPNENQNELTLDLAAPIPVDVAICSECLRECHEHADRRHRYPLTSCTRCGPRYTIIGRMPYERADTTMANFKLCDTCGAEYESPLDRRFHAQTIACARCGPNVWCVDHDGHIVGREDEAIQFVVRALLAGKIAAIRGIGGYQLLVDATNESAVRRLRERKRRSKPLAIMVETLRHAAELAWIDNAERDALADASNPIVLLRAKSSSTLAPDVIHPGLDTIGLMLPATVLHALIARGVGRPLVCTSGNLEGEPLEFEVAAAQDKLAGICDVWLHHDRPIARPIDDSVVRVIGGQRATIRLARGLAPLPLDLSPEKPLLALGGYLKSAAAWSNGSQAVLGPHIGDHQTLASRERFVDQCRDWRQLYRFQPEAVVHDCHPEYFTTTWAKQQGVSTQAVQHHHAHIVAGMLEHGWLDREVLGVSWDGTGYGNDGTIWGGEFLLTTAKSFRRVASVRRFCLPGGDAAVREPWRVATALAASLLQDAGLPAARRYLDELKTCLPVNEALINGVQRMANSPGLCATTTSAGRLFDAAAAIILGVTHAEYDGQPAMLLESAARRDVAGQYDFPLCRSRIYELDWRPLFAGLLADRLSGLDPAVMAMKFHRTMAEAIVRVCGRYAELPVVLGGGVFQNRLLTELIVEMFGGDVDRLGLPGVIPANDGGLAAGQLAIAIANQE